MEKKIEKNGLEERVLDIRRVTRVKAGGKRFRFRAVVIIGDRKGKIGIGIAKGVDVAEAIKKSKTQAQKKFLLIPLKDERTISYEVEGKYSAARVRLKPAKLGHGLIAGGACRVVLELVGVKDISAKILSHTSNKLTNALATIEALRKLEHAITSITTNT